MVCCTDMDVAVGNCADIEPHLPGRAANSLSKCKDGAIVGTTVQGEHDIVTTLSGHGFKSTNYLAF